MIWVGGVVDGGADLLFRNLQVDEADCTDRRIADFVVGVGNLYFDDTIDGAGVGLRIGELNQFDRGFIVGERGVANQNDVVGGGGRVY